MSRTANFARNEAAANFTSESYVLWSGEGMPAVFVTYLCEHGLVGMHLYLGMDGEGDLISN